eukprot:scaffold27129_cov73-Attheya_sp.AAC.6
MREHCTPPGSAHYLRGPLERLARKIATVVSREQKWKIRNFGLVWGTFFSHCKSHIESQEGSGHLFQPSLV